MQREICKMTRELFTGFSKSRASMPNTIDRVAAIGNKIDVTFVFTRSQFVSDCRPILQRRRAFRCAR
jgi:hypothetical protein